MDQHDTSVADRLVEEFDGVLPEGLVRSTVATARPQVDLTAEPPHELSVEEAARADLQALSRAVVLREAAPAGG